MEWLRGQRSVKLQRTALRAARESSFGLAQLHNDRVLRHGDKVGVSLDAEDDEGGCIHSNRFEPSAVVLSALKQVGHNTCARDGVEGASRTLSMLCSASSAAERLQVRFVREQLDAIKSEKLVPYICRRALRLFCSRQSPRTFKILASA